MLFNALDRSGSGTFLSALPRALLIGVVVLTVCAASVLHVIPSPLHAGGTTHYVDEGDSIQAAINAAAPGDTIVVNAGTYVENLTVSKSLTLQSADGPEETTIEPTAGTVVAISSASAVTIDGFTVTGGTYGVTVTTSGSVTLSNLTILGGSNGVRLNSSLSNITIRDCTIANTTSGGIYKDNGHGLEGIEIARVSINPLSGSGIFLGDTNANANYVLKDVKLTDVDINGGGKGIHIYNFNVTSGNVDIVNCTVSNTSDHGIHLVSARSAVLVTNTTVSGVTGASGYGMRLEGAATVPTLELSGNEISGCANGLYVQQINLSPSEHQLTPSEVTFTDVAGTAVYLQTVSGVTVSGHALDHGGMMRGVQLLDVSDITVEDMSFSGHSTLRAVEVLGESSAITLSNLSVNGGRGVHLQGTLSNITIRDSVFAETTLGGVSKWSNSHLEGVTIARVTVTGAGISLGDSGPSGYYLTNVDIDEASVSGGHQGIYVSTGYSGSGDVRITNCIVADTAHHGIEVTNARGVVTISNNVVSGITGSSTYGMYLTGATTGTVADVEVSGNTLEDNRNGLYLQSVSDGEVSGNTIRNNTDYGIDLASCNGNLIYDNCLATNGTNARDNGSNTWNVEKTDGTNIIGGAYLGGNYWSDYTGEDTDNDGLGDTMLPYNCGGEIHDGGDCHPLVLPPQDVSVELSLMEGWNLISVPLLIGDSTVEDVFSDADCEIETVYTWDAAQQCYEEVHDGNPSFNTIEPHRAYWVKVTSTPGGVPVSVTISGEAVTIEDWSADLSAGWNMVGAAYSDGPIPRSDLWDGGTAALQLEHIYYWNVTAGAYAAVGAAEALNPGVGYWMACSDDCPLSMAGPPVR